MIECPYCEYHDQDPDDCPDSATIYFTQCSRCTREYRFEIEYIAYYDTYKIPCKDDEPHEWLFRYDYNDEEYWECTFCEKREIRKKVNE